MPPCLESVDQSQLLLAVSHGVLVRESSEREETEIVPDAELLLWLTLPENTPPPLLRLCNMTRHSAGFLDSQVSLPPPPALARLPSARDE